MLTSLIVLSACQSGIVTEIAHKSKAAVQTRAEWRALVQWPKTCDDGVSHIRSDSFVGVDVYAWSAGRKLVSVVCETGVYTRGEMVFLETAEKTDQFNLLVFPQFKEISGTSQALNFTQGQADYYQYSRALLWGRLRIDSSHDTIRYDAIYRGGGGCGISTTYALLNNKPVVTSLKTQQCESNDIPISQWQVHPLSEYSTWPVAK